MITTIIHAMKIWAISAIVLVAVIMGFSAIAPAIPQATASESGGGGDKGSGGLDCKELFAKLAERVGPEKAREIISKIKVCGLAEV